MHHEIGAVQKFLQTVTNVMKFILGVKYASESISFLSSLS